MEFDFSEITVPFRMQPGLSRMPENARHTRLLDPHSPLFREKLQVLSLHVEQALLQLEDFDPRSALLALAQCLAFEWPEACSLSESILHLHSCGLRLDLQTLEVSIKETQDSPVQACVMQLAPHYRIWAAFSLFLQEDLAILDGHSTQLKSLAVCIPSHWAPEEKIGLALAAVHAPVADNTLLLKASESLSRLVTSSQKTRWQRFVWTLQPSCQYDGHPKRSPPRNWPKQVKMLGEQLWMRVEHQSFIAVPLVQQAVFTIRVMLGSLESLITDEAKAARLHAAISSMSDAVIAYRGLGLIRPLVLEWLKERMSF